MSATNSTTYITISYEKDHEILETLLLKNTDIIKNNIKKNKVLRGIESKLPIEKLELRWEGNWPQIWLITENGDEFLTICLDGALYGNYGDSIIIPSNVETWILENRGEAIMNEDEYFKLVNKLYAEASAESLVLPYERHCAWLTLAFLILGNDQANKAVEEDSGVDNDTSIRLEMIPKSYYQHKFYEIQLEFKQYDHYEKLYLNHQALEVYQQGAKELSDLSLVLATQRHTMKLMAQEIEDLKRQLKVLTNYGWDNN